MVIDGHLWSIRTSILRRHFNGQLSSIYFVRLKFALSKAALIEAFPSKMLDRHEVAARPLSPDENDNQMWR